MEEERTAKLALLFGMRFCEGGDGFVPVPGQQEHQIASSKAATETETCNVINNCDFSGENKK